MQDRSEWRGFVRENEPLTLTRCHSSGMPQLYEAFEGWKSVCGRAFSLKGIKGKISVFRLFLSLCFFYRSSFHGIMRADPKVAGGGIV